MQQSSLFGEQQTLPGRSSAGLSLVRVAVERGIERPGQEGLTYHYQGTAPSVGDRVSVPLGRSGKPAPGIVIAVGGDELLGGISPSKVKPLLARAGAALSPELVDLGRWMASYYVSPLGMVLATMMPAAVKRATGRRSIEMVELTSHAAAILAPDPPAAAKPTVKKAWLAMRAQSPSNFPIALKELALTLGLKSARPLRDLADAGVFRLFEESSIRAAALTGLAAASRAPTLTLSPEQAASVEGISAALGGFSVNLIYGVTGSGKTEVYLRLIERVLELKRTAVVLVPEIALTPQTASRFTGRFGPARVAVMHSGLTASQRNREWARVSSGEARVVVGARSAVFAPLASLGLIIVDEEHDSSYKQDQVPRYNARDVAIKRAQLRSCPVVLGSATPSLESWHNAISNRSTLWTLPTRVGGASMPRVEIVSIAAETRLRARLSEDRDESRRLHLIGPTLEHAIEATLQDGGQIILLLNRRGLSHYLWCPDPRCGFVLSCDQCDATLVTHRYRLRQDDGPDLKGEVVRCHHCLAEQRVPRLCPACGKRLAAFGAGTQRVEDEIQQKFAWMGIREGTTLLRLDSDSMRSAHDYFEALSRFGSGEVRILLGTQMIAKGLDYPGVTLVGVIDADTALKIPDFRAAERTFQLVSQVAGRAGRGEAPGRVVVQTMKPDNPAIRLAAAHDFAAFAADELTVRRRAQLPPVTRMARIVCRDESSEKAHTAAAQVAAALTEAADTATRISPPLPCTVSRIAGQYRFCVDVTAPSAGALQSVLAALRLRGLLKSDAKTAVDVDPLSLM